MRILGASYLNTAMQYSSLIRRYYEEEYLGSPLYVNVTRMRTEIRSGSTTPSVEMGSFWFGQLTLYINFLQGAHDELLRRTVDALVLSVSEAKTQVYTLVTMTSVVSVTLLLTAYFSTKLVRYIQGVSSSLSAQTSKLDVERRRNEWLIHSILPPSAAAKLLAGEVVPPEMYECVTVMFSDIVSFTQICALSSPLQVVLMLNMIYAEFDDTLDVYDVYKVETIGDAYMVTSGLPVKNGDKHVREIALLSLHMQSVVGELKISHLPDRKLQLRIGINSGPCVAGVVGHKNPRYCLFGDTVNTASRMESHGKPGMIHCSEETYRMLRETREFSFSSRGQVDIKGKGLMSTWWLNSTADPDHSPGKVRPRAGSACGETLVYFPDFSSQTATPQPDVISSKIGSLRSQLSLKSRPNSALSSHRRKSLGGNSLAVSVITTPHRDSLTLTNGNSKVGNSTVSVKS